MTENILFVCDDNAILSPMAEAFVRRYGFSSFKVFSAGIFPKAIHLNTFRVMEEIGYDLYGYRAKSIFEFDHLQYIDSLITLTDYVNDNFIFNKDHIGQHLHWPFRNLACAAGETREHSSALSAKHAALDLTQTAPEQKTASGILLVSTNTKVIQVQTNQPNAQPGLKQFRLIRDEMECQVMNWLEENGIGPLWWCR